MGQPCHPPCHRREPRGRALANLGMRTRAGGEDRDERGVTWGSKACSKAMDGGSLNRIALPSRATSPPTTGGDGLIAFPAWEAGSTTTKSKHGQVRVSPIPSWRTHPGRLHGLGGHPGPDAPARIHHPARPRIHHAGLWGHLRSPRREECVVPSLARLVRSARSGGRPRNMAVDSIPGSPVTAARRAIPASYQGLKSNSPVERPREKPRSVVGYGLADRPRHKVEVPRPVASVSEIPRHPRNGLKVPSGQGEVARSLEPKTASECPKLRKVLRTGFDRSESAECLDTRSRAIG